jgi:DNA-binding MarR family transcriptional regulator
MASYQLRPADFTVLCLLRANPGISQKRVAGGINVSAPNLAPILDRLEARGLVKRERGLNDKRVQALSLTEAGQQLCIQAEQTVTALENEATAMLSSTERRILIGLLQKIYLK